MENDPFKNSSLYTTLSLTSEFRQQVVWESLGEEENNIILLLQLEA
jgi:hypothetical protein